MSHVGNPEPTQEEAMTTGGCTPSGCQCACHNPGGMGVAHLVACCTEPLAPIERFGLKLTPADFDELGKALDRVTEAERASLGYDVARETA